MAETRISTGVAGLDEVLCGGLLPSSSYLVAGGAGTGKTVLSMQFLHDSALRGASCLLITLAEPERSLRRNAAAVGQDLAGVTIVDLTRSGAAAVPDGEYTVFPPAEVEPEPIWKAIYQALDRHSPQRLVLDSATFLRYLSADAYQCRKHVQRLFNELADRGCVSLVLVDSEEMEQDQSLALAADGVILLRNESSENRLTEIRTVEIIKVRGSAFLPGRHPLRITSHGMTVWPHRIEKLKRYSYDRQMLASGVAGLDEMLCGGVPTGTCTLISGPAGVGKTSLALQFLASAAASGFKAGVYTFEEGLASMLERCRCLSIPLEPHLETGTVIVREFNPLQQYPDEFLASLREDVEVGGVNVLLIDSLRGYNLAMEAFGNMIANVQNIINYVRRNRAALFLVNEQEKLTGDLQITDMGVSYAADNVLLLRYAEYNGRIIKVISCLKKRLGEFLPELREFRIGGKGISIGERLTRLQGLLTGTPRVVDDQQ